jgi:hypothetical protein
MWYTDGPVDCVRCGSIGSLLHVLIVDYRCSIWSTTGDHPQTRKSGDFAPNECSLHRHTYKTYQATGFVVVLVVRAGLDSRSSQLFLCQSLLMRLLRNLCRKCWTNYVSFHEYKCPNHVSQPPFHSPSVVFCLAGIGLPIHHTGAQIPHTRIGHCPC